MNIINKIQIFCKDLKVFDDNSKIELFSKEKCLLIKKSILIETPTKDGIVFNERKKSWYVYVDYVDVKYLLNQTKLHLVFIDNNNVKCSGQGFALSKNHIQGNGELCETK